MNRQIIKTKGLFIVFEGISCAGKTTQSELLCDLLHSQGRKAIVSPEPTRSPLGELAKNELEFGRLNCRQSLNFNPAMAHLFAADRNNHLYHEEYGIAALWQQGVSTIVPRYYFSSLAYNQSNTEEEAIVESLNRRFPQPDLTIYLDIPVIEALNRLTNQLSHPWDAFALQGQLCQYRKNYQRIFQHYSGALLWIDGCQSMLEIAEIVGKRVKQLVSLGDAVRVSEIYGGKN